MSPTMSNDRYRRNLTFTVTDTTACMDDFRRSLSESKRRIGVIRRLM